MMKRQDMEGTVHTHMKKILQKKKKKRCTPILKLNIASSGKFHQTEKNQKLMSGN